MTHKFETSKKTGKQQLPLPLKLAISRLFKSGRFSPELIKVICPSISLSYLRDNKKEEEYHSFYNNQMLNLYFEMLNDFSPEEILACVSMSAPAKWTISKEVEKYEKGI